MMRRAQPWLGTLVEVAVGEGGGGAAGVADAAGIAHAARIADTADGGRRSVARAGAGSGAWADAPDDTALHAAVGAAFAEVALVQRLMSFRDADSDVARLNRARPGALVAVHDHTWAVLALAQRIGALSDGVFDVGCAPLLVDWDYLPAPTPPPRHPPFVAGRAVYALERRGTVCKAAEGWIDLGGIAKGYAVDLAIAALERAGVASACVNAGGDLRVLGARGWPVTVRDPRAPSRPGARLDLADGALATSARYFSGRWRHGRDVCALVDGRNGAAVASAASVSVRAPSCAVADALTKVVIATGDAAHPALAALGARAFIL